MSRLIGRLRGWYGANPLHLLSLLAAFALAGYAVRAVVAAGQWRGFALWFAAAIVGHDLLLFPLYSLADLSLRRLLPRRASSADPGESGGKPGAATRLPPVINYLRMPAGFAVLLLVVWFPLILGLSAGSYNEASGLATGSYLWRWLAITGVMFTISAVSYAVRLRRMSAPAHTARRAVHRDHP